MKKKSSLNELSYDMENNYVRGQEGDPATALIIFKNSDLNAAAHYFNEKSSVATLILQESICNEFLEILKTMQNNFPQPENYSTAVEKAGQLKLRTLNLKTHLIVHDVTHEHLGLDYKKSGLVTCHIFRTGKEAISLLLKESLDFPHVSIWNENHSHAYEIIDKLNSSNYFINCFPLSLDILKEHVAKKMNYAIIDNNYHYETINRNAQQKCIVFPIGGIFGN